MKKIIWVIIVFTEVTAVIMLSLKIHNNKAIGTNVLGTQDQHISPIKKDALIFPSINVLRYYYEFEPNVTIPDKPDWLPYKATYVINKEGLNGLVDYSIEKPDHTFRIVAIGDSFTFGAYVNTEDNYPSKLERLLNTKTCGKYSNFEVLNVGMGGYDIQYAVERFERHGQKYNPDLVLWIVNSWNLKEIRELLHPLQNKIEDETSESEKQEHYSESDYAFIINKANEKLLDIYGENYILNQQKQFFQKFSDLYKGKLVIVMFSNTPNYLENLVGEYIDNRDNSYLFNKLTVITDDFILADGHPNAKGYDVITQDIYNYLTSNKLLSCQ